MNTTDLRTMTDITQLEAIGYRLMRAQEDIQHDLALIHRRIQELQQQESHTGGHNHEHSHDTQGKTKTEGRVSK